MRNLLQINKNVAGHYLSISHNTAVIKKSDSQYEMPMYKDVEFFIDKCNVSKSNNQTKCSLSGWAYDKENLAPVKSIYVSYLGKLISRGKVEKRIDVRVKNNLSFDSTGFGCEFSLPMVGDKAYVISIVFVTNKGICIEHLKLSSKSVEDLESEKLVLMGVEVVRPLSSSFKYRIEKLSIEFGCLRASGWSYFPGNLNSDIYVGFLNRGVLIGKMALQKVYRSDVESMIGEENPFVVAGDGFYGFEYISNDIDEMGVNVNNLSLDIVLIAPSEKIGQSFRVSR